MLVNTAVRHAWHLARLDNTLQLSKFQSLSWTNCVRTSLTAMFHHHQTNCLQNNPRLVGKQHLQVPHCSVWRMTQRFNNLTMPNYTITCYSRRACLYDTLVSSSEMKCSSAIQDSQKQQQRNFSYNVRVTCHTKCISSSG